MSYTSASWWFQNLICIRYKVFAFTVAIYIWQNILGRSSWSRFVHGRKRISRPVDKHLAYAVNPVTAPPPKPPPSLEHHIAPRRAGAVAVERSREPQSPHFPPRRLATGNEDNLLRKNNSWWRKEWTDTDRPATRRETSRGGQATEIVSDYWLINTPSREDERRWLTNNRLTPWIRH